MSRTQAHLGATRPRVGSKYLQLLLSAKSFRLYKLGLDSSLGIQP